MADGITISIDSASLGLMLFMIYKLIQLEYRVRRIEEVLSNESYTCESRR